MILKCKKLLPNSTSKDVKVYSFDKASSALREELQLSKYDPKKNIIIEPKGEQPYVHPISSGLSEFVVIGVYTPLYTPLEDAKALPFYLQYHFM